MRWEGFHEMRALITGIAGMIGSHLAERLFELGWEVDGIDDLSTGNPENVNHAKLGVCVVAPVCDIGDYSLSETEYDVIFHLAAHVGPAYVTRDALGMLLDHGDDAVVVCELAERTGATLVMTSTSEVYQYNTPPFRESDNLTIGPSHYPRCAYAVSKLNMEHIGLAYHRQHGVKTVIARLCNCVGPRQREKEGFVLPIFAKQALTGQPITVHGDGSAKRVFTHVKDTVEALIALATTPEAVGEIVNVSSVGEPRSVLSAAYAITDYCLDRYGGPRMSIQSIPYPDPAWEAMRTRVADVSKLERLTGLRFGDRWDEIVADVCADQARQWA